MTKEDRKVASGKKAEYRGKIKMNESEEEAIERRARQAKARKRRRDRKYDTDCERKKLPRPAPREDGDTAATTWAKRKICRDAEKRLEEEKVRDIQLKRAERRRYCAGGEPRVWLPSNAKGPGIRTEYEGSKFAYGREAAAALHSAIKDDMKNGKATVYSNPNGHVGLWKPIQHKRCKGFVRCNGLTGRCYNMMGPKRCGWQQCYGHEEWVGEGDLCKDCAEGSLVEKKVVANNELGWVRKQYHHINGSMHELAEKVRIDATREQKEAAEAKAKLDADEARRQARLTEIAKRREKQGLTLDHWKKNVDNTFNGDLYGSKTIKDGTNYTTTKVVGEFGDRITTEDGTTYTLGYRPCQFCKVSDCVGSGIGTKVGVCSYARAQA
jgi:hypothetical protein